MSLSHEMREKIDRFAGEQSPNYLAAAEMTYLERLRQKAGQTRQKVGNKLSRFKPSSEQAREAKDDMVLYMTDYMNDLMSKGMSEDEAFNRAREALAADEGSELQNRFVQYYENRDPADYEAVGLFYGGFLFLGFAVGACAGYILGGGRMEFMSGGWIDTLVGAIAGAIFGIGIGEICNAIIAKKGSK